MSFVRGKLSVQSLVDTDVLTRLLDFWNVHHLLACAHYPLLSNFESIDHLTWIDVIYCTTQLCYNRLLQGGTTSQLLVQGNEYFRYPQTVGHRPPSPPIITCSMIRVSFPLTSNHHLPPTAAPTAHQTTPQQPRQHYGLPSKRPPFLSNFSLLAILKATFAPPALITGCQDHHLHHHNHRPFAAIFHLLGFDGWWL